jgi:hypothetical protein
MRSFSDAMRTIGAFCWTAYIVIAICAVLLMLLVAMSVPWPWNARYAALSLVLFAGLLYVVPTALNRGRDVWIRRKLQGRICPVCQAPYDRRAIRSSRYFHLADNAHWVIEALKIECGQCGSKQDFDLSGKPIADLGPPAEGAETT